MSVIQIKSQVSLVENTGVQVVLPENVTQNEFTKGVLSESTLINNTVSDSMTTPVEISLALFPNTTCFVFRAEYAENDLAAGIKKGDRAKFQVRFDSGNWLEGYSVTLEGYKPSNPTFQLRASGSQKILIKRTIGASE